jgi:hypothetical protein
MLFGVQWEPCPHLSEVPLMQKRWKVIARFNKLGISKQRVQSQDRIAKQVALSQLTDAIEPTPASCSELDRIAYVLSLELQIDQSA